MSDYEIAAPTLHFVVLCVLTAVIAGSLWLGFTQRLVDLWNGPSITAEALSIPEGLHVAP